MANWIFTHKIIYENVWKFIYVKGEGMYVWIRIYCMYVGVPEWIVACRAPHMLFSPLFVWICQKKALGYKTLKFKTNTAVSQQLGETLSNSQREEGPEGQWLVSTSRTIYFRDNLLSLHFVNWAPTWSNVRYVGTWYKSKAFLLSRLCSSWTFMTWTPADPLAFTAEIQLILEWEINKYRNKISSELLIRMYPQNNP